MSPEIGIITEQGDLGLGFDALNPKDQKSYNESTQPKNDSNKESNEK